MLGPQKKKIRHELEAPSAILKGPMVFFLKFIGEFPKYMVSSSLWRPFWDLLICLFDAWKKSKNWDSYIPGGCLGFLNHQQYGTIRKIITLNKSKPFDPFGPNQFGAGSSFPLIHEQSKKTHTYIPLSKWTPTSCN